MYVNARFDQVVDYCLSATLRRKWTEALQKAENSAEGALALAGADGIELIAFGVQGRSVGSETNAMHQL